MQRLFPVTKRLLKLLVLMLIGVQTMAEPGSDQLYSDAELDQLLAPIALYPDPLLSQILMASTYPLEIVEADRWSRRHPGMDGEAAVAAAQGENWDPSVAALSAIPRVLAQLSEDLEWTQAVGDAYVFQEGDVIASIQRLRNHAYDDGALNDLSYSRVYREQEIVYIEPVTTQVVYVPYYDSRVVYRNWWWDGYPPHYWGPPAGYHSGLTFYWGEGISIAPFFFYSTFNWHDHHIALVDRHHYVRHYDSYWRRSFKQRFHQPRRWVHSRADRHSVYRATTQNRYRANHQYRSGDRDGYRSRDGARSGNRFDRKVATRDFNRDRSKFSDKNGTRQQWNRDVNKGKSRQERYADHNRETLKSPHRNEVTQREANNRVKGYPSTRDPRDVKTERPRHGDAAQKQAWSENTHGRRDGNRQGVRNGGPDKIRNATPGGRAQAWNGNRNIDRAKQANRYSNGADRGSGRKSHGGSNSGRDNGRSFR